MSEVFRYGAQSTWFEEPDVIGLKMVGVVSAEESRDFHAKQVALSQGRKHVFLLVDMSDFSSVSSAGRKYASEGLHQTPIRGIAVHQAGITARVLGKLVVAGVQLFTKDETKHFPLEFFPTEAEARAWIDQRRRELTSAA